MLKKIEKAKKFLFDNGYGTGTNFTISLVAHLLAEWQIINQNLHSRKIFIEEIAKLCHQVNKAYCDGIGDNSQVDWNEAPEWQRESAINGVIFHLENPNLNPSDGHKNWMADKEKGGWKYGKVKNIATKEHPCMVPYEQLPKDQQVKDALFIAVVKSFE